MTSSDFPADTVGGTGKAKQDAGHKLDPTVANMVGESGGGSYPNPHSGTNADTPDGGPAYKPSGAGETAGATTKVGYHGSGKAGDRDYSGQDKATD